MMGATRQLQALYERFDDMITGKAPMTTYEAAEFKRELRAVMARVGLMELGIASNTLDEMVAAAEPALTVLSIAKAAELGPNIISLTKARLDRIAARYTDGGEK